MQRALITLAMAVLLCSGCHHVASDYGAYLAKHPASPTFLKVPVAAEYAIDEATLQHRTTIRSGLAGQGNRWIVEFGQMLEQTMASNEVRAAFAQLSKAGANADPALVHLALELVDYQVSGMAAHVRLHVVISKQGATLIDKIYIADGPPQAGKVAWGGAFAMRNALHVSTKQAMDVMLREVLIDVRRVLASPGNAGGQVPGVPIASNPPEASLARQYRLMQAWIATRTACLWLRGTLNATRQSWLELRGARNTTCVSRWGLGSA